MPVVEYHTLVEAKVRCGVLDLLRAFFFSGDDGVVVMAGASFSFCFCFFFSLVIFLGGVFVVVVVLFFLGVVLALVEVSFFFGVRLWVREEECAIVGEGE